VCKVLLLTDDPDETRSAEPDALIEEARQLQRTRATRRNIVVLAAASLVILGLGATQLIRGESSAAAQASPSGAAGAPSVTYEKIVVQQIVPHLPVETRTVELWSSSARPGIQRAIVTLQGGHRFEVGTAVRHDKTLGLVKVAYFYDSSTDTIYRAGYLNTAPDPSPGLFVVTGPVGGDGIAALPVPAGKQPTPAKFFDVITRDPDSRLSGPRNYRGRSVYVVVNRAPGRLSEQTFYFDVNSKELVRNEIDNDGLRNIQSTIVHATLPATKANFALASLQAAHPHARAALQPLRIKRLSGEAFYVSGGHSG
jgi:hypothetical protein